MSRSQRVLIIGPSNVGDAILASPVIAAATRRFPQAHVTLVVGARAAALFTDDPRVQALVDTSRFDSPLGRLQLALALWRYHPHVVIDLRHTLYPLLLTPWSAWRVLRRPPRALAHMRARHLWSAQAQVPALRATARATPAASGTDPLCCTAKDAAHVEGLWKRWGLTAAAPLVLIAPGARSHIKRWTAEGFARVADQLIGDRGAQVIFSGESDEEPIIEEIRSLMRHSSRSAAGLVTIRQLGRLMAKAQLVITNDSASLHVASALNVPTVAIFGPTDERKYGPTAEHARVIRRRLFCAPCEASLCRFQHECMRFVNPDEVYEAAATLLTRDHETRDMRPET